LLPHHHYPIHFLLPRDEQSRWKRFLLDFLPSSLPLPHSFSHRRLTQSQRESLFVLPLAPPPLRYHHCPFRSCCYSLAVEMREEISPRGSTSIFSSPSSLVLTSESAIGSEVERVARCSSSSSSFSSSSLSTSFL
ncbi:hypothetical protein PENTCL1PPCAC_7829, partial [Pristionchus entomophagus]